jgi:acetoin utilization protein AcuB
MLCKDVMSPTVVTVTPEQTLRDALMLLQLKRIRQLPVVADDGRLVGIITDRDIKRATPSVLSSNRDDYDRVLDETPIGSLMTREPITVTPETSLKTAVKLFVVKKVGALPIVEGQKLVGIITQTDALRLFHDTLAD